MYKLLLAVHILGAVIWVGGATTVQVLTTRIRRADEPAYMARITQDLEKVGQFVFLPSSIIVLLAGIGLVADGGWGFGSFWVLFGLVAIIASAVTGAAYLGPESGRIGRLIEERGPEDPEIQQRMARIFFVSRIELAVLLLVVIDMAVKPGA